MARFNDHIQQSLRNLSFLEQVNKSMVDFYDWQVTISFYAALHFINAHLSTLNLQYRKHKDVKDVINPYSISPAKLPENEYHAYVTLQSLSRRARYLVNEKDGNLETDRVFLTYEKHLARALKHLNTLMCYFNNKYSLKLSGIRMQCQDFKYQEAPLIKS